MGLFRDLAGNGNGVNLVEGNTNLLPSGSDVTVPHGITRARGKGAGDVVFRPAGATADMTMTLTDGEYIDIAPGSIIRSTGTTVTALHGSRGRKF